MLALDQVKQHFDLTFAGMMQEIKDMKAAIEQSRRASLSPNVHAALLSPSNLSARAMPPAPQPLQPSPISSPTMPRPALPANTSPTPANRTPVRSEAELRAQAEEIDGLRRDLAVIRQIHVDFLTDTKDSFAKLRKENANMRELVKTKMGGSRALLDNSKAKLEALCADTIGAVEEISDVIDAARLDAFKRFVTPSKAQMTKIRTDLAKAHELVDAFAREMSSVEPTWRATWHFELSRVMDEQRLLPHQSKLAVDLKNDIKDAEEMFKNVSDFVNQRAANTGLSKGFRPVSPDEGSGGIPNLLMEIRTKESDPNHRLRAIEAQQRARERELANKSDDFTDELTGFVQGKKLKKTGGTDEVDRQRQRKQEMTLKRMLSGDAQPSPTAITPQLTGMSNKSVVSDKSVQNAVAPRSGA